MDVTFTGLMPAMTTPFNRDLTVDHAFLAEHARLPSSIARSRLDR
jgi:dihydrodipicolinate synthase/N-acetylneuraminate lyase